MSFDHTNPTSVVELWTYVLKRIYALRCLLDLAPDDLRDKFLRKLSKSAARRLTLHDLRHLLPNGTDLRRCCISCLLDLVWPPLGERNGEETEEVIVGCLDDDIGFDEGLPLANQRAKLVRGKVEAMEIGQAVLALHFVDP